MRTHCARPAWLTLCVLVLLAPSTALAQTASVSGRVDVLGRPAGLIVHLRETRTGVIAASATVAADGTFSLPDLQAGRFELEAVDPARLERVATSRAFDLRTTRVVTLTETGRRTIVGAGDEVRVSTETSEVQGRVLRISATTIDVRDTAGRTTVVPRNALTSISVRQPHQGPGAVIGLVIGGVGAWLALRPAPARPTGCYEPCAIFSSFHDTIMVGGTAVGAGLGAIVGGLLGRDVGTWHTTPVNRGVADAGAAPRGTRGRGLGLRWTVRF